MVTLRNNLVHHFIDQHDLSSLDGCRGANAALVAAYKCIDLHFAQLRDWADDMVNLRQTLAEITQSDVFHDVMKNGVKPDGTVFWPNEGIVHKLREAAGDLTTDGWVSIDKARRWITERYPEHTPSKYGYSSWRQVVHESRQFDLKYFAVNGVRVAWYREKEGSANSH